MTIESRLNRLDRLIPHPIARRDQQEEEQQQEIRSRQWLALIRAMRAGSPIPPEVPVDIIERMYPYFAVIRLSRCADDPEPEPDHEQVLQHLRDAIERGKAVAT